MTFDAPTWQSGNDRARAVFKRFYADGEGGAQYSFGVPVPVANSTSHRLRRDALHTILESRLRSRHRGGDTSLREAGPLLADLFAGGTTKGNRLAKPSPHVEHGRPLMLLQGLHGSAANGTTVSASEDKSDWVLRDLTAQFGPAIPGPVLMIDATGQRDLIRSTRIILARLYLELFCFERCIALLQAPAFATLDDFGRAQLLSRTALSAARLAGTRAPAGTQPDLYDMLGAAFAKVHRPGRIDELNATLRIAGASPNLCRAVISAANRTDIVNVSSAQPFLGGFVQMTNYNNFGQAAAFGENAQASNFVQAWDRQRADIDLPALAVELSKLQLALQSEASEGEEHASVAAIAQAKEAAEAGDGPSMLGHLAQAGKWTLSVAEKIGVGLAVAVIKSQVGF